MFPDDEDQTVVSVIPISDFTPEALIVSDPAKSQHFPPWTRPALMVLLMGTAAGLGALGALTIRSEKPRNDEGNHSHSRTDTHDSMNGTAAATESGSAIGAANPHNPAAATDDQPVPLVTSDGRVTEAFSLPSVTVDTDPFSSQALGLAEADSVFTETVPPQVKGPQAGERTTLEALNQITQGDDELIAGNYVRAMRIYQDLRKKAEGVPGAAILFRLALCAEAAGHSASALEAYRRISGSLTDPAWAGVARYGEARCLTMMKRSEGLQSDLLKRALLDETEFLPTVRGEVLHLIGRSLWRQSSQFSGTALLDDVTLIVPEWSPDPVRLLQELPLLVRETPTSPGPAEFVVRRMKDNDPDAILIRLNCGTLPAERLLTNLIQGCRLSCDISEPAQHALRGRSQHVRVTEQSLAMILDGLTISTDVVWVQQGATIGIRTPDELTAAELRRSRLDAAERILRTAVLSVPGSIQIGHSRLALSTLLIEQKRSAEALQYLQVQVETQPRSVVESEAAFNLGKCLMSLNRREEAIDAFLRSIDAFGGNADIRIASYIFHSRLLVENNLARQAIQSMMRGLSLSEGSELQPQAALHLASLYLLNGSPQGANAVLMERRSVLEEGLPRRGAEFLAALARYRAAVLPDRREREASSVISALSGFRPAEFCGGHWSLLTAGVCEELGLAQEATDAYAEALQRIPPCYLRNQTILKLVSHYESEGQFEQAQMLLTTLNAPDQNSLLQHTRIRTAELALAQNRPEEAITSCRAVILGASTGDVKRAALKIMGQAYERQKNHKAAIYCFAGMLPDEIMDATQEHLPMPAETRSPDFTAESSTSRRKERQ